MNFYQIQCSGQARAVRIAGMDYAEYVEDAWSDFEPATTDDHVAVATMLRDIGAFDYSSNKRRFGLPEKTLIDDFVPSVIFFFSYECLCDRLGVNGLIESIFVENKRITDFISRG